MHCKITAIEKNKLLCFEWKGDAQFSYFMNTAVPLTHVSVLFLPNYEKDNSTEIHLIHTGWGSDEIWKKARVWFDSVWKDALNKLKNEVNN